ncbi:MAG TPA: CARDB domain-containing protein [Thermomonospora sp.]|nr:CARDB domain-containing protein [Thermomonospora sp.]
MKRFIVPAVAAVAVLGSVTSAYAGSRPAQGDAGNDLVATIKGPGQVRPGGEITFQGTVRNTGPGAQANASAAVFVTGVRSLQAPGCRVVPHPAGIGAQCSLGTLAVGQSKTVTWKAVVPAGTKEEALFSGIGAEPLEGDANPDNNGAGVTVKIVHGADLGVTLTGPRHAAPKSAVTYAATVRNAGPKVAAKTRVAFTVPRTLTQIKAPGCTRQPTRIVCGVGDLKAGAAKTVRFTGTTPAKVGTKLTVAATASAASPYDPRPGNNTRRITTNVIKPRADVRVAGRGVGEFVAGRRGVYRFTVTNTGPLDARGVVVSGALPKGLTLAGVKGCAKSGNGIRCVLPRLAVGQAVTIEVTVAIGRNVRGPVVYRVAATAKTPDPAPANNTAVVRKVVQAP